MRNRTHLVVHRGLTLVDHHLLKDPLQSVLLSPLEKKSQTFLNGNRYQLKLQIQIKSKKISRTSHYLSLIAAATRGSLAVISSRATTPTLDTPLTETNTTLHSPPVNHFQEVKGRRPEMRDTQEIRLTRIVIHYYPDHVPL